MSTHGVNQSKVENTWYENAWGKRRNTREKGGNTREDDINFRAEGGIQEQSL